MTPAHDPSNGSARSAEQLTSTVPNRSCAGRKALITGITGQDGSYLAESLLAKGYEVHGIKRRSSSFNTGRVDHLLQDWHDRDARLYLHFADLSDSTSLVKLLYRIAPDEIYHLGAQSHVRVSFDIPEYTGDVTALGTTRLLDAIRESGIRARFYNAGSSEMFGQSNEYPQNERTPFRPRSPYGCAKLYSYWMTANARAGYGLFGVNGILFNHESPRRGEIFVSRKITRAVARILHGLQEKLFLGNLEAQRDWGYAPEYVEGMWQMLQQAEPDDYVLATGETHSVREFVELAFAQAGLDPEQHVEIDPQYYRPTEIDRLLGDASKAKAKLGWSPRTCFRDLVKIMVEADIQLLEDTLSGKTERRMYARAGE
ncbi:MAG TPA: GDP-mannose 4,6-dehydratase [Candidatus Limnocylindrales bacterium]|nr:GDP-mannose 4,6-dehydratase [Candidatus Limnocylindrales bacterium]